MPNLINDELYKAHIKIGAVATGQKRTLANKSFEVTSYGTLEYKPRDVWSVEYTR